MTTEGQACGLGSFIPMSCRGRAEAFARRLQSRLQSLGRAGSGDGASPSDDEASWFAKQPEVTSHQPRLSSSSESDIYFDFDMDYESPGSPVEETTSSETFPTYLVNKNRTFECSSGSQYSTESDCVSSSAITGTSPGSDSSDGVYFDSENVDTDLQNSCKIEKNDGNFDPSLESTTVQANTQNQVNCENEQHEQINGYTLDSPLQYGLGKLNRRRNFRNAAGFRISPSPEIETPKQDKEVSETALQGTDSKYAVSESTNNRNNNSESLSNESSTAEEYFECLSLKTDESGSENLNPQCLLDSGYPNTAESSRCNSQNETLPLQLNIINFDGTSNSPDECHNNDFKLEIEPSSSSINSFSSDGSPYEKCESSIPDEQCPNRLLSKENLNDLQIESSSTSIDRPDNLDIDFLTVSSTVCEVTTGSWSTSERKKEIEDDDDDRAIPRVRRCSSLKTGKTPPGTPGRKKIVRFADVLGLDLADIRTFLDEVPKVPQSAYEDLRCAEIADNSATTLVESSLNSVLPTCIGGSVQLDRLLIPMFQQPGGQPDFMDRVREEKVCLENACVTDTVSFTISGTVRVRNLDFHKSVHIRYSLDSWQTFADLQATYMQNSCDGFSDKFSFNLYGHTVQIGQRLEFAVRFQCKGSQYWDSNQGANYVFQCLPPTDRSSSYPPIHISPDEHFNTSFY